MGRGNVSPINECNAPFEGGASSGLLARAIYYDRRPRLRSADLTVRSANTTAMELHVCPLPGPG